MVAMPMAKRLPVGAMVLPSPPGIGRVKVPVITPVTAVHVPDPKRMGWTLMVMSGAKTKSAFRSSMCRSMPFVSWPSGHVTTMSLAWLSWSRSHFWLLKTSNSSVSNTLRFRSTAGACFSWVGGGVAGFSAGVCASAFEESADTARAARALRWLVFTVMLLPSKVTGLSVRLHSRRLGGGGELRQLAFEERREVARAVADEVPALCRECRAQAWVAHRLDNSGLERLQHGLRRSRRRHESHPEAELELR